MRHARILLQIALLISLISESALQTRALAMNSCEAMFQKTDLKSQLPVELQSEFALLAPRLIKRFEANYDKREVISAEREAALLVSKMLLEADGANLRLRPLVSKATRHSTINEVLQARLRQEDSRVLLERRLLEVGYGQGSVRAQKWAGFRQRHATKLRLIAKFAKNTASTMLLGVPIFLSSTPSQNFSVPRSQRDNWDSLCQDFETKIATRAPKLIRQVQIEAALDLAGRIAAVAILAILTDELLNHWKKWHSIKAHAWNVVTLGHSGMESYADLERMAYSNWKDVIEAFTGTRPVDDSNDAIQMLQKIRATSREDLWLHVHREGPLSDLPKGPDFAAGPSLSAEEVDQMFLGPSHWP